MAKVDVKVGHGDPLGVQKTLEQQVVLQRVQVGDLQGISHQRARTRAAPRPDRAAVGLGPVDEVAHDQKVTRKTHLQNGVEFKLEPLHVQRHLFLAFGRIGVQMRHALLEPLMRGIAEILFRRHALAVDERRRELRQIVLAQHQCQAATLGNLQRVGHGGRQVGKQRMHLLRRLEILLTRVLTYPLCIAKNFTISNTHTGLVGLKVICRGELHRMCGHHWQLEARGQLHGGNHMGLVIGAAGTLKLQVKAVGKHPAQLQRYFAGTRLVTLH